MKRKILLMLIVFALVAALLVAAGCNGSNQHGTGGGGSGPEPGGGGSGTEPGGEPSGEGGGQGSGTVDPKPDTQTTVNVKYRCDKVKLDETKYPITVKAGTEVSNYSSITLSAAVSLSMYEVSADKANDELLNTYSTKIAFDVPFTLYRSVQYFEMPELDDPSSVGSNWWGGEGARTFDLSNYTDAAQLQEKAVAAIKEAALSELNKSQSDSYVVGSVSSEMPQPIQLRGIRLDSMFNVVETDVAVQRVIDGGTVAPYNMEENVDLKFKSLNNETIPVTSQMIKAAYAPGEVTAEGGSGPDGLRLLIDRKQFKANCVYGGIPYEITINFTINQEYDTIVDLSVYGSGIFQDDEFVMSQLTDGQDLTVTFIVRGNVNKSYPLEFSLNDIESCQREDDDQLTVTLKEELVFDLFALSSFRAQIIEPNKYTFNVKDVTVAKYEQLSEEDSLDSLTLEYSDGHIVPYQGANGKVGELYKEIMSSEVFASLNVRYAGNEPYHCNGYHNANGQEIWYDVTGKLKESVDYAVFENNIDKEQQVYRFQTFSGPAINYTIEYYYDRIDDYRSDILQNRYVPIPADFFTGIPTDKSGVYTYSLATEDMLHPEQCDSFTLTVLTDAITELTFEIDLLFEGIIVDEPIDLSNCYTVAHYAHGQTKRVPLTEDMLGEYDKSLTDVQNIPVTFNDGETSFTGSVAIPVFKVKSFSFYSGLEEYYLKDDEPEFEVWLKVTYSDDTEDYVEMPPEKFQALDTSRVGSGSITLTYGGVTKTHSYNVIEGMYLTYSKSDHITFLMCIIGIPDDEAENVFIPEDIRNIVLPADIDGVPVTALSANLFANTSILQSLVVPDSVTSVGYGVVDNCKNLHTLTIPGNVALEKYFKQYKDKTVVSDAVYPTLPEDLTVVISDSSTALCDNFLEGLKFEDKEYMFKLDFGAGLVSFDNQSYSNWSRVSKFSATGNTSVQVKDNVVFTQGGKTLWYYPDCKTDTTYSVEEGVTTIGYMSNQNLLKLVVAASVETLPNSFMSVCRSLQSVVFAPSSKVKELPIGSFGSCEGLTEFTFPDHLQTIGVNALTYINVNSIILPKTVTSIGRGAFDNAKCKQFYLPSGATQSCLDPSSWEPLQPIHLPNLVDFAYDGSVSITNLSFFKEASLNRYLFKNLYITGEKPDIEGDEWFFTYANQFITSVHVYGGVEFNGRGVLSSNIVTYHSDTSGQWW